MKTRLIIVLLCAGALAFACGPRSRTVTPPALASALPVAIPAVPKAASTSASRSKKHNETKPQPKIDSKLNVAVKNNAVKLALDVRNIGERHVELLFPTGQSYDFVVVDSTGREVWRWSADRMFTTGVRNKQLGTGESLELSETWSTAKPGRYTAIATLKSSNFPVEEHVDFVMH